MSLINDALKRATSFKKQPKVELGAPLQPVMPGEKSTKPSPLFPVLAILLVLVVAYVGWSWWSGKSTASTQASGKPAGKTNVIAGVTKPATKEVAKTGVPVGTTNNNPIARSMAVARIVQAGNKEGEDLSTSLNDPGQAVTTPVVEKTSTTVPAVTSPPPPVIAGAESAPNSTGFPAVNVQAIYFRQKGPSAVVNGKTVRAGDSLNGMKVASIERNSIKVEFNGQLKEYPLR